ncbi:MAG: helix-turn-helix domain-containing protein [Gordonia polyisoprenivorans]|nr:helix-turn-helix domain-containing protein [Gordonia polyisoprenivorans]
MTVAGAAEYLGVSEKSIRRWISSGRLSARRAGPRLIRIDPRALERMMDAA